MNESAVRCNTGTSAAAAEGTLSPGPDITMTRFRSQGVAEASIFPAGLQPRHSRRCLGLLQCRVYGGYPILEHNSQLISAGLGSWSKASIKPSDRLSGVGVRGRRYTSAGGLPPAGCSPSGGPGAPGFRDFPAGYASPVASATFPAEIPTCLPRFQSDQTLQPAFVNPGWKSRGAAL